MKKLLIGIGIIYGMQLSAQDLPQLSPKGEIDQTIGLTEVEIEYSRPSRRDREIFGDLLPYGEVWRTGANARATIEFEDPISINGNKIEPGKYAILTVPEEKAMLFMLNSDTESWGANNYTGENNVLELKLKYDEVCELTETFTMGFENFRDSTASLFLKWEKTKIHVDITTFVNQKAWANIDEALENDPEDARVLRNAAKYAASSKQRLDEADGWIEKSIKIEDSWFSHVVKARVFAAKGDLKDAEEIMLYAINKGKETSKENGSEFRYEKGLLNEIEEWKK